MTKENDKMEITDNNMLGKSVVLYEAVKVLSGEARIGRIRISQDTVLDRNKIIEMADDIQKYFLEKMIEDIKLNPEKYSLGS